MPPAKETDIPPPDATPPQEPPASRPCVSCGSPHTASTSLCPACQRTLKGFAPGAPFDPEAEPFTVQDRVCLSCGYSLSGLRSDRDCPECGTPIARSLQGNLLRFSSPAYVKSLHTGIVLAEVGTISIVFVLMVHFGLMYAADEGLLRQSVAEFGAELISLCASAVSFAGWWMFSAPDPSQLGHDTAIGARKLLRISLGVEAAIALGTFATSFFLPVALSGGGEVSNALAAVGGLFWLFRFFTSLHYMRTVALRLPDANLYQHAGRFMWLGPVVTFVLCGLGVIFAYVSYIVMLERARVLLKKTHASMTAMTTPR
jgi:predicted RNA-binding Zn-ribbon protein involved in translation (DUF1610 family)